MASLLDNIAIPSAAVLQLFAVLGVIFVLLKVAKFYRERKKLIKTLEAFPGPPKHWLYGHNHLTTSNGILNQMVSWGEEYPYAFPKWYGLALPSLIIHHPEYAKSILGRIDRKSNMPYKFFVPWIGQGLLILAGSKWFQHRKLLTPAFHYDVLKSYVALMSDSVKVMLDKWEKKNTERKSVEVFQDVSLMTLDSIMKCAFSYNTNCQTQRNSDYYIRAVYNLNCLVTKRIASFSYKDIFYDLTHEGREFKKACKLAHTHTDKVIKERKMLLSSEKELDKIQKKHMDFLDILLCTKIYDPLRFSPENSAQRHSHAFLPFSAGFRNCIGQQFAMNEMKVALALTLLRFELSPNPSKPPRLISQVILKSSNGVHLHLKKIR
ncbi:cytochrome P450 4B1-like [Grus japonensis]|uniref:Cytochrome P450 4B1-like n=1 Tax=Grus japonensis TaxID=30415 RepID=A0ABC9X8T8_GRUJA